MIAQLVLCTKPAAYFLTVALVKTSSGITCLGKASFTMMLLLISNSLNVTKQVYKIYISHQWCPL